jgi:hypothetical protein
VSMLVDSFEELESEESDADPERASAVLEEHLSRLVVTPERLLENLDANLRHVYPSYGHQSR